MVNSENNDNLIWVCTVCCPNTLGNVVCIDDHDITYIWPYYLPLLQPLKLPYLIRSLLALVAAKV